MMANTPILNQQSLSGGKSREITVERLSDYLLRNQNIVFPHRHDFYHCMFFTKGGGTHQIDFEKFDIVPGHIYFMSPAQIHSWSFEGDMEGYVINFDPNVFTTLLIRTDYMNQLAFFDGTTANSVFTIDDRLTALIKEVLDKVIANHRNKEFAKVSLLYFLHILDLQVSPDSIRSAPAYNHILLRNFMALLESNYKRLRLPKDYANLLYITPHHLNALCKENLGSPAGEVIRKRILLEAKRLLAIKGQSISEIAYELNFSDNSYFTKFFKKAEHITPEEFRAQLTKS